MISEGDGRWIALTDDESRRLYRELDKVLWTLYASSRAQVENFPLLVELRSQVFSTDGEGK